MEAKLAAHFYDFSGQMKPTEKMILRPHGLAEADHGGRVIAVFVGVLRGALFTGGGAGAGGVSPRFLGFGAFGGGFALFLRPFPLAALAGSIYQSVPRIKRKGLGKGWRNSSVFKGLYVLVVG